MIGEVSISQHFAFKRSLVSVTHPTTILIFLGTNIFISLQISLPCEKKEALSILLLLLQEKNKTCIFAECWLIYCGVSYIYDRSEAVASTKIYDIATPPPSGGPHSHQSPRGWNTCSNFSHIEQTNKVTHTYTATPNTSKLKKIIIKNK